MANQTKTKPPGMPEYDWLKSQGYDVSDYYANMGAAIAASAYNNTGNSKYKTGQLDKARNSLNNPFRYGGTKTDDDTYENFIKNIDAIVKATQRKGSALNDDELYSLIGIIDQAGGSELYKAFLNENYDAVLGTGLEEYQQGKRTEAINKNIADFQNALKENGIENQQLAIPEQGQLGLDYQTLLDAQNQLSDTQYLAAMESLQRSENDMYRALGMSQRQMERDIAKRRQQALKSGMSTAQLAAQEQQNLLAAQTGATQIAQQYADQRYNTINQFAGAKDQNYINALQAQIGWNQQAQIQNQNANNAWAQTMASYYAQAYAADQSVKQSELLQQK